MFPQQGDNAENQRDKLNLLSDIAKVLLSIYSSQRKAGKLKRLSNNNVLENEFLAFIFKSGYSQLKIPDPGLSIEADPESLDDLGLGIVQTMIEDDPVKSLEFCKESGFWPGFLLVLTERLVSENPNIIWNEIKPIIRLDIERFRKDQQPSILDELNFQYRNLDNCARLIRELPKTNPDPEYFEMILLRILRELGASKTKKMLHGNLEVLENLNRREGCDQIHYKQLLSPR